ncbi:MAG: replication initiator protein A [Trichococcus flocculiformis]|jgi:hypothetical protein
MADDKPNLLDFGDDAGERSPLLPVRHTPDFFLCDVFDAAFKGDTASMEHPIFSLSKKPDMKARRYENGENWLEVHPSASFGLATIFDRDILIYCISQLVAAINSGKPISQTVRLRAHDLMIATNRDTGGYGYKRLTEAFNRLRGTMLNTNIVTGGKETWRTFGLVDSAEIVKESRDGRMQEVEIKLSDWVFQAIEAREVLTINRRYFQLAKPLERRLYELARKHVGNQASFRIGLDKLQNKCGSQSTLKEFRRLLLNIIADDEKHDHMPEYSFHLDGQTVEMRQKKAPAPPKRPALPVDEMRLKSGTYESARELATGWDIYRLESEWRAWLMNKAIVPKSPDAHFLAFCKRRGKHVHFV